MPYTFGAGTGDDINFGATQSTLASATMFSVSGWFRPTTLTAGNTLWSAGSVANCAVIGATTSELELLVDYTTTDGKWTTSGLGLTTGGWRFIAVIMSTIDTPLMGCRVWAGTVELAPTEVTCTQTTAPVGTSVGVATWYVGNKGTGLLAFQGDISDVMMMNGNAVGTVASLSIPAAYGTFTQAEADLFRDLYVRPAWGGDLASVFGRRSGPAATAVPPARWFIELNNGVQVVGRAITAVTPESQPSINTATVTATGCPRPAVTRPGWPRRRR